MPAGTMQKVEETRNRVNVDKIVVSATHGQVKFQGVRFGLDAGCWWITKRHAKLILAAFLGPDQCLPRTGWETILTDNLNGRLENCAGKWRLWLDSSKYDYKNLGWLDESAEGL